MKLYRGQILAGITAVLLIAGIIGGVWLFLVGIQQDGQIVVLLLVMLSWILALVTAAWAYVAWVPKWERNDKRGRSLADASEPSALLLPPWELGGRPTSPQNTKEKGKNR